jgi:hypothetical protein
MAINLEVIQDQTTVTVATSGVQGVAGANGAFATPGGPISGSWITHPSGGQGSNAALTQNSLGGLPILVPYACTIDALGLRVYTLSAGSTIRLGIYDAGNGGLPKTLLLDAGTVSGASTGDKTITGLSLALSPGTYWLCGVAQGGTPAVTTGPSNVLFFPFGFHTGSGATTQFDFQGSVTRHTGTVSGTLPATFIPDLTNNASNSPRLFARVA